ncbi:MULTISPECIES: winged helix DNA-binding domain-containing protein [Subtercola]|uniref:Winged helix DNA-binding domain-containing protein n=1 Tax=Subtercola vilae TaxID=2056433 RepID=A0A4T2BC92_9MICO|nr:MULTISPECIES: winged helix DNA-binding domain-containing protein [Subtercola]MEA9985360.1 winged helix DNA-binding domain-containing protein [Subtercola sp. RTI3]TIH28775.1 winged helix DNA-binding domain-containing protein [Subtercola vilae]
MLPGHRRTLTGLRLVSQGIQNPVGDSAGAVAGAVVGAAAAAGVVGYLAAVQAQDLPGAKWSVGLRMPGGTLADVDAALADGSVVRSWPFRGTLHFVAGVDLRWMLDLTATRTLAGAATRHRQLGLHPETFALAHRVAVDALEGHRNLTRDELFAVFRTHGIATDANRGSHLLWYLSHHKVLCFGPMKGAAQTIVLLDEWISQSTARQLTRDESLGELARRYFSARGPATVKDFLWWSGLLLKDATLGIELAGDALESMVVDDRTYLRAARGGSDDDWPRGDGSAIRRSALRGSAGVGSDGEASDAASANVHLLPGFDEYLLGYSDRSAPLAPEHMERVVPSSNGLFLPTIVAGGHVAGTWRRHATSKRVTVTAEPFEPFSAVQHASFTSAAERYARYLGLALASS